MLSRLCTTIASEGLVQPQELAHSSVMSLALLSAEIRRFLASEAAEVLCITGRWGVGKTYAWAEALKAAQAAGDIRLEKYSYVSLFGQSSLSDVRSAIWENSVSLNNIGFDPSIESVGSALKLARKNWKRLLGFSGIIPGVNDYAELTQRVLFMSVSRQLICIDDLERSGADLRAKDVLGLISFLKENRKCKIALLLNDEALIGGEGQDFRAQVEKVADAVVSLNPTPEEAARIGANGDTDLSDKVRTCCAQLRIVNIRVIGKIFSQCKRVGEILIGYDDRIIHQAVQSVALFMYSKYQPEVAPPIEFLKSLSEYDVVERAADGDPNAMHRALLSEYGFGFVDGFDKELLLGVERGGFDEARIRAEADIKSAALRSQDIDASFKEAWDLYHASFDNNADDVINRLNDSVRRNVNSVTPSGLDATIRLMRDLGQDELASDVLNFYVENRVAPAEFWDLDHYAFSENVKDIEVIEKFAKKLADYPDGGSPLESLLRLGSRDGWGGQDIERASLLTADDMYRIFKELRGDRLRAAVRGSLFARRVINADAREVEIANVAEDALRRIAAESAINARRIRLTYGIEPV